MTNLPSELKRKPPSKKRDSFLRSRKTHGKKDDTRQIAFEALCQVLEQKRPLEVALDTSLSRQAEARDRSAAHRLVACVLRRKGTLEAVVEPLLKREPPTRLKWILIIGIAQILFLETPMHAAVDTTVNLARNNAFDAFTGLVNAVMHRIAKMGQSCLESLDQERLNIPTWLWQSWKKAGFNPRHLARCLDQEAPLDISVKPKALIPEGGTHLPIGSWRYPAGTKVMSLQGYQEGNFWVQDVAASLPALLLNVQHGEKVADLCAAPGGKTAQLIMAGGHVIAVEKNGKRLQLLQENLQRLQLEAELIESDATQLSYGKEFDAILLDAPCSSTGIFRRHPDVLHLKKAKDITALIQIQRKLIQKALTYLKPGGRLIYSVCSLQKEEAEQQAEWIGNLPEVEVFPIQDIEISALSQAITPEGWIRTLPWFWDEWGGMDGFFVARFRRKSR